MPRVLLVSNSFAGSVSHRTREVIVKALAADFDLQVAETTSRDHASDLARSAVAEGADAVLAFGGDGTINEVAQGLVGTDVALGILPGGSTNVMARALGVPRDPVEATAFVAAHLRSNTVRRINVGRFQDRYFLFSAGMGLDAEVVKRVEADPEGKRKKGEWLFAANAVTAGLTQYRIRDPEITLEVEGAQPEKVVLAICCNGRPFTYFGRFPVDAAPLAQLDGGLDFVAFKRLRGIGVPRLVWSLFVSRSHPYWRNVVYHHGVTKGRITAEKALPAQVDGDYIGERDYAEIHLVPSSLSLLI
ncbi:MAG TPA: diacylglycerol kinase family protein [Actinomycetota bacterium]|nr:diacylglycerol kinase family protein [Actinomycetota bacterium]